MKNFKSISIMTLLSSVVIFTACSNTEDPAKIDDSNHKEEKKDNKEKDSKSENQDKKDYLTSNERDKKEKDANKKVEKNKEKINLDTVITETDKLHDFIVEDSDFYTNLVEDLSDKNIKLDGNYSSPYIDNAEPDDIQPYIFAGIITDKKVDKQSKNKAIITYKVRSGLSNGIDSGGNSRDIQSVGEDIQNKLKSNDFKSSEKTVKYKVTLNKDQTQTNIKKLTTDDWSVN